MPRVRGGWAWWVAGVLCVYVVVWLVLVGLGRAGRCQVASQVRDGLPGAVVVSWRLRMEMGGVGGAQSGLVVVWVMHGMVVDETLHVFPGGGVGELLSAC